MKNKKTNKVQNEPIVHFVMFGFKLKNIDETGYLGEDLTIVQDVNDAKKFPNKKTDKNQKGFADPFKWAEFINESQDINHGYKFHPIKIS